MSASESMGRKPGAQENPKTSDDLHAKKDRRLGLGIVGAAFLIAIGISWYSAKAVEEAKAAKRQSKPAASAPAK